MARVLFILQSAFSLWMLADAYSRPRVPRFVSPRLAHRVLYAFYLAESERQDAAQEQLVAGIREYEYAPKYLKRHNRETYRRAKEMLQTLSRSA